MGTQNTSQAARTGGTGPARGVLVHWLFNIPPSQGIPNPPIEFGELAVMYRLLLALIALVLLPVNAQSAGSYQEREVLVEGSKGKDLDAYLRRCAMFGFSGSVLVAQGDQILLRKGYGEALPGEGAMNGPETLYDIASASKQVTAAAILMLESMGKLSTRDSISKHLDKVPERHHAVTIQHLLNHTSGFARYGRGGSGSDRERAVAMYLDAPRGQAAGEGFEYFNGGYALLAAIVERTTGQTFETWVTENLFVPAGLKHTYFSNTVDANTPHLARSHDGGKLTTDYIHGWGYKGMGGVVTSVSDLYQWIQALHTGKVLSPESMQKWLTPALENYACGWYVLDRGAGKRVVSHGGTAPGFQTYIRHFVDEDVLVLLMSNRPGMHWQVTWGLSSMMVGETEKVPAPPATETWKTADLEALTGVYASKQYGRIVVQRSGAALRLGAEGDQAVAILQGQKPSKASAFKWERKRAHEIIKGLLAGKTEALERDMLPHIPKTWPGMVLSTYWPKHLAEHGEVTSFEEIGASEDSRSGRVSVLMRLHHAESITTVEVAFAKRQLNIFDMNAPIFAAERPFAPIGKSRFATYEFNAAKLPTLTIKEKSKGRLILELQFDGKRYAFTKPGK
ncbi:MAG: CubicO group peptidase (beta-lactamase class C family) [Planctomycetota bacterium]|jgi:CubicO group peptidase (beta-lactamase class C family)